jgi:hypothetical protein
VIFDLCQAQRPVGPGTRENDADGAAAVLLGQRSKEMIDRQVPTMDLAVGRQPKDQALHSHTDTLTRGGAT